MTSKNLFFNLMKENTKQRLWTVALISLIFFFTFPVQTALLISSYLSQDRIDTVWEREAQGIEVVKQQLQERFLNWTAIDNGTIVFLLIVFAVVCGISGFSYLHSRKKTDFYHAIPVRREKLFAVVYLNGVLYTAAPYLISLLISSVMIQVKAGQIFPWGEVLKNYLIHMSFFLLIYTVVIASALMTGNTIVNMLGTAVFFLWGPGSIMLLVGYFSSYYVTFYQYGDRFLEPMEKSSPVAWYIAAVSMTEKAGVMALWALLATALLIALCVFLYKKRPSEAAGRAMAFRKSQPVIKLLLVVPIALTGSLIFKEMMGSDGWSIFGLICGLVISYSVIEIIYNFDFRRLFSHKKQFALCLVCSAGILAFFRFDLSGYDSYVPSEAKLESAGIYCRQMDSDALDDYLVELELNSEHRGYEYVSWKSMSADELVEKMKLTDVTSAVEIGKRGVADAETAKNQKHGILRSAGYYRRNEGDGIYDEVVIAYHLKGGKSVLRRYNMNLSAVSGELDKIYDSQEYKNEVYPVLAYQPLDIAGINYEEYGDFSHVKLKNDEIKAQILETYQRELRELTADTRRKESPIAAIQFKTVEMQDMIDRLREKERDYSVFNRKFYYPIYPSFTETISLLRSCGTDVGELLTPENVDKIVMEYYSYEDDDLPLLAGMEAAYSNERGSFTVTVTDKDKIGQILDSSISDTQNCTNYLNPAFIGVRLTAYVPMKRGQMEDEFDSADLPEAVQTESIDRNEGEPETEYSRYGLNFEYRKVPEFVKETFRLTEENMKDDVIWGY